jgi:hypothetical protein
MANGNPPWLDALLAQAYPGVGQDMSQFGGPAPQRTGTDIGAPLGGWTAPQPGSVASGGIGSDARFPSENVDPRLLPAPMGGIRSGPPRPHPSNVGGAPSPGVPAPQGVNRSMVTPQNPNYSLVQYNVGGGAQSPRNAPIYTAGNFGGPQNAGWGQQGQFPQQQQPRGALANPQGGGSGFNVAGLFQNLPDNAFDGARETSGVAPASMGPRQPMSAAGINKMVPHYPGNFSMSPDQLNTYMQTQPWLQNLGG